MQRSIASTDEITRARARAAGLPAAPSRPDPPLVCFPLRADWERERLPILSEPGFPAPLVTSRTANGLTFPAPGPVLELAELAREHGWEVIMQYSRGRMPHATTGRPGGLKDLIGLRFGKHPMTERQAYAVYSRTVPSGEWSWSSIMLWGPDLPPFGRADLSSLKAYLISPEYPDEVIRTWVGDLGEIADNAKDLQKRRDAFRKWVRALWDRETVAFYGESWPFALLHAAAVIAEIRERAAGLYTDEGVIKVIETRKTTEREGRR